VSAQCDCRKDPYQDSLLLPEHDEKAESYERPGCNNIAKSSDSPSKRAVTRQESSHTTPGAYQNKENRGDQSLLPSTASDVERRKYRQVVTTIRKRNASDRKNLSCRGAISKRSLLLFSRRTT
jgi:hypothetical protein